MLLKTGVFIDGTGDPPQYGCCIAVEAGKIAAVGRQADFAQAAMAKALDYSSCTVLPGLIDSHVHLFLEGIADSKQRQARWLENKEITLLRAAANLKLTLEKGVTTIRDLGGPAGIAALLKQAVKQKVVRGPRVLTCNRAISITGGHFHYAGGREADDPAELAQAVREQAAAGADCIKLMATGMVDFRTEQTGRLELTAEDLKTAMREARRFDLPVSVHVNGDDGVRQALAAGVNTLEHGMLISEAVVDLISISPVHWLPTLTPVFRMLAYSRQHRVAALPENGLERVYTRHCAMVRRGIEAGADLIAGTDAGSLGVEHGEVRQELILLTALGMPPAAAIAAATGKAAKAIGLEATTGVLKAGKDADLLVIQGNPLADMKALWNIVQVYQGGVPVINP